MILTDVSKWKPHTSKPTDAERRGAATVNVIDIDLETCNGCGLCYKACFADVLRWDENAERPVVAYPEDCAQCNLCELNCPVDAITVTVDWDKPFPSVLERQGRCPA